MEWTQTHDTLLCREVLLEEPYKYKEGSNERGKKWTKIAEALNKSEDVKFKVTQRGVRERMERLQKKQTEKKKEEESASGIVRITDIDGHIEYITFAKEYGSKKGQTHPTWRRVVCNYERFL